MPKVTTGFQEGGRIRIELNYEDYKTWEEILGINAEENTTMMPDGSYWKTLLVVVGHTEYRFGGPVMTSRSED
jgi:hypothetical protein